MILYIFPNSGSAAQSTCIRDETQFTKNSASDQGRHPQEHQEHFEPLSSSLGLDQQLLGCSVICREQWRATVSLDKSWEAQVRCTPLWVNSTSTRACWLIVFWKTSTDDAAFAPSFGSAAVATHSTRAVTASP